MKLKQAEVKINGSELFFTFLGKDKEIVDSLFECIKMNKAIMREVVKDLPRKMKIVVKELHPLAKKIMDVPSETAAFHHVIANLKTGFSMNTIWIFPEALQNIKVSSKDSKEFWDRIFFVFLHELAHYLASDEKETNDIVEKWLRKRY